MTKFNKTEEEAERKRVIKVFTDHAFQFLACADAITKDPRLACVYVPIRNGMMYMGMFPCAPLGAYVELWTTSLQWAHIDKDGLSLIWSFGGSPLSGLNFGETVWEDGTCRCQQPFPFGSMGPAGKSYLSATKKYRRLWGETNVKPLSLDDAVQWVEERLTPETYRQAIARFTCSLQKRQQEWAEAMSITTGSHRP